MAERLSRGELYDLVWSEQLRAEVVFRLPRYGNLTQRAHSVISHAHFGSSI